MPFPLQWDFLEVEGYRDPCRLGREKTTTIYVLTEAKES